MLSFAFETASSYLSSVVEQYEKVVYIPGNQLLISSLSVLITSKFNSFGYL